MNLKEQILATLTYFNMFDYPLRKREIFIFLGQQTDWRQFDLALNQLIDELAAFKIGEFYSLFNNYALAERRTRGNEKAIQMLKKAERASGYISAFPYVKAVAISGSLSKKFASEDADADFFIITAANRLWIARTFLHLFKKITFFFKLQDLFCMNYFIDEESLCILEKNIYTATETTTLLPVRGIAVFEEFFAANAWTRNFLPNNHMRLSAAAEVKQFWLSRFIEKMLNNKMGDWIDNRLMQITAKSWNRKTKSRKTNRHGALLSMHTGKHFSKPNPENFQQKLLQRYKNCLAEVHEQYIQSTGVKNNFM